MSERRVGSDRMDFRQFRQLSFDLIKIADRGTLISDYLKDVSIKILDFSKASQLNIVVSDIKNYYRFNSSKAGAWNIAQIPQFAEPPEFINDNSGASSVESLERTVYFKMTDSSHFLTEGRGMFIPETSQKIDVVLSKRFNNAHFNLKVTTDALSLLILPIRIEKEVIGVVTMKWDHLTDLTDQDIEFYQYLFDILGFARSHRQAKFHLGERIKELTTIFQITRLGAERDKSLDDVLKGAVDIIPPGFLRPDIACCKIVFADEVFTSANYIEPRNILREYINVGGKKVGTVEVGYIKDRPNLDKGPFLKEERPMLKTIAREIGLIAERKQFENEKEKLHQQLLHADRLVTVGQLTAGVAHELNEPLGSILGFAQLIKKYGEINENVGKDIDKIIKASLHAREIIRKLMLFSRQKTPEKTLFNINERIDDGLYLLESRIRKSNIRLVKNLSEDLPLIKIDPSQLHQVLVNLVVNAIQAMPEGGTLTITTEKSINTITLKVKDTGIGMTRDQMDKIFIPFFTTKDINEGTGLGLPVVLGIVQSHGGYMDVESTPGEGSTFIVKFPVNTDDGKKSEVHK